MSKTRKLIATTFAALLLGATLSAPAHAVYFEEEVNDSGSIAALFEGLYGFLSAVFAANNGGVVP